MTSALTPFVPATELARLIAARERTAAEVASETLARIERLDPSLAAFVTVTPELALGQAAAVDRRIASGEPAGPLAGVPVSIKDLTAIEGVRTTFGSRLLADFVAPFDEHMVGLLRAAGAVFVGKTNTCEFGASPTSSNDVAPPTRNPWDLSRSPGGSSGGAAAAIAAGMGPLAEGSDGAGSIRIPASCCGVVGLKPSRGRVSMAPVFGEAWSGLATSGPLARTVADVALMLDVMAGPASGDPHWAPPPAAPFRDAAAREPGRLRLALAVDAPGAPASPEVRAEIERVGALLESLGHVVEPACPALEGLADTILPIMCVALASAPFELAGLAADKELLTPFVRALWERGERITAVDHARNVWRMHLLARGVVGFFDGYDALVTPTLSRTAPPFDWFPEPVEDAYDEFFRWFPFTFPFNMTGQPAISVPAGWTTEGLPVGVQIVGRPADEATILSLAAQLERATPWVSRTPPSFV